MSRIVRDIMYVKVFSQILESSIASDYNQRHLFMDLLVLADREGVVDMTIEAIARRLNVPELFVRENLSKLEQPDPDSRGTEHDGRRLIPLDAHRTWGWQIVNYAFYRDLRDLESLRAANRDRKRRERERKKESTKETKKEDTISVSYSEVTLGHAGHNMSQAVRDIKREKQNKSKPVDYEELKLYLVTDLRLTEEDAAALWEHWKGNGFSNNGRPMVNWRMVASNWERRGLFFPSKKQKGKFL